MILYLYYYIVQYETHIQSVRLRQVFPAPRDVSATLRRSVNLDVSELAQYWSCSGGGCRQLGQQSHSDEWIRIGSEISANGASGSFFLRRLDPASTPPPSWWRCPLEFRSAAIDFPLRTCPIRIPDSAKESTPFKRCARLRVVNLTTIKLTIIRLPSCTLDWTQLTFDIAAIHRPWPQDMQTDTWPRHAFSLPPVIYFIHQIDSPLRLIKYWCIIVLYIMY